MLSDNILSVENEHPFYHNAKQYSHALISKNEKKEDILLTDDVTARFITKDDPLRLIVGNGNFYLLEKHDLDCFDNQNNENVVIPVSLIDCPNLEVVNLFGEMESVFDDKIGVCIKKIKRLSPIPLNKVREMISLLRCGIGRNSDHSLNSAIVLAYCEKNEQNFEFLGFAIKSEENIFPSVTIKKNVCMIDGILQYFESMKDEMLDDDDPVTQYVTGTYDIMGYGNNEREACTKVLIKWFWNSFSNPLESPPSTAKCCILNITPNIADPRSPTKLIFTELQFLSDLSLDQNFNDLIFSKHSKNKRKTFTEAANELLEELRQGANTSTLTCFLEWGDGDDNVEDSTFNIDTTTISPRPIFDFSDIVWKLFNLASGYEDIYNFLESLFLLCLKQYIAPQITFSNNNNSKLGNMIKLFQADSGNLKEKCRSFLNEDLHSCILEAGAESLARDYYFHLSSQTSSLSKKDLDYFLEKNIKVEEICRRLRQVHCILELTFIKTKFSLSDALMRSLVTTAAAYHRGSKSKHQCGEECRSFYIQIPQFSASILDLKPLCNTSSLSSWSIIYKTKKSTHIKLVTTDPIVHSTQQKSILTEDFDNIKDEFPLYLYSAVSRHH